MLRFAVYDDKGPASDWPVDHAYLFGPDDIPVAGETKFKKGELRCKKASSQPAGLCLQYDSGSMGRLMLQTCLLPDRDEPYILSVELARHRIKMFIAKSEEWQMFDLSAEHPAMQQWEDARQLLTESWTSDDPLKADRAARKSLTKAIDATERLAMAHAEILLHRRYAQRAASSATLGIRVWAGRDAKPLRELIEKEFDVVVLPLSWKELEVSEGNYEWGPLDRWMEWATKRKKPIVAGPLIDFSTDSMPHWMKVWQHDYDTARDLIYDHIEKVVGRYRGVVGMWNITAGVNMNQNFSFSPDQMLDLVRMTALHVRQSRKGARVMIELAQPFGEHFGSNRDSIYPITFAERLIQEGIRLDAIGVRLLFGSEQKGLAARDLMQISSLLDKFFFLEIPIVISALGVPSESNEERGGTWRDHWSTELQTKWISRLFAICLSKPFVESLFWTDLFDYPAAILPGGGLISDEGKAKPALQRLLTLRRHLRKPMGNLKLQNKTKLGSEDD